MRVEEDQSYPDHPERFDSCPQVLCREGLTGRCYWEVERRGGVGIGVTYRGITRRGRGDDSWLGRNNKSWSLECHYDGGYTAWYNRSQTHIPLPPPVSTRVGVYVDRPAGSLSFYRVSPAHLDVLPAPWIPAGLYGVLPPDVGPVFSPSRWLFLDSLVALGTGGSVLWRHGAVDPLGAVHLLATRVRTKETQCPLNMKPHRREGVHILHDKLQHTAHRNRTCLTSLVHRVTTSQSTRCGTKTPFVWDNVGHRCIKVV
ncbi:Stonustoxin subunit beta [Merluccius polli]|uniref:Stonustoxin subunit beta n=1 Tax=Merluccius polli TaxID=89951 RepID=A0AA47MI14_MERPO|nr:Stonustoxin subunit beta [Merluccius polli]